MARTGFNPNRNTSKYTELPSLVDGSSLWNPKSGRNGVPSLSQGNAAPMQFMGIPELGANLNSSLSLGGATPTNYGVPALSNVGDSSITPDFSSMDYGADPLTQDFSTPTIPGSGKTGFDLWGQGGQNLGALLQGGSGLFQGIMANKMLKQDKRLMAQNKQAYNIDLANTAKITNAQIRDRANKRSRQRSDLVGDFAAMQAASDKEFNERKVSGQGIA